MDPCRGEECEDQCRLEWYKCDCECLQQAYPAPQRKRNWTACLERRQCHNTTCGECTGAGTFCDKRCKRRCECNCAGWPRRDLSGEWEECFIGTQTCEQAHSACVRECGDQDDCKDKCYMDLLDCSCACRTAEEEEWRLWDECKEKSEGECKKERCECDELDGECSNRCKRNCLCGCLGITADRLDDSVQQCQIDNKCQTTREDCLKDCDKASDKAKRKKCKHACILTTEKCNCECARSRPPKRVEIIQHCNYLS
ncbi:balbiani ring protein 3-like [Frankliniella occidentalis]|uniref:Balbiani ring protein 3-like n=1 Tax=Frankliniella occidentalis TaxID=133901 RepID=A0A6J1SFS5_FRAOC|nr:balbiani ring protein 3-like [Frankliniella occidentalis]